MTSMPPFQRPRHVAVARSATALYVMVLPDGPPRTLNGPAEVIWEVATSGSRQVVRDVAAVFDVEPEEIRHEVEVALRSFVELHLIEPAESPGEP